jgi:hypothetical protein
MLFHGDDEPFVAPLCAWLGKWLAATTDPRMRSEETRRLV